jgi:hypothetical protein
VTGVAKPLMRPSSADPKRFGEDSPWNSPSRDLIGDIPDSIDDFLPIVLPGTD